MYCMLPLGFGAVSFTILDIAISTNCTVRSTLAESLVLSRSVSVIPVILAMFVRVCPPGPRSMLAFISRVTVLPTEAGTVPMVQMPVAGSKEPVLGVLLMWVTPEGSQSCAVTFVASLGPTLLMVTV